MLKGSSRLTSVLMSVWSVCLEKAAEHEMTFVGPHPPYPLPRGGLVSLGHDCNAMQNPIETFGGSSSVRAACNEPGQVEFSDTQQIRHGASLQRRERKQQVNVHGIFS
jgi:hypothetical protein